MGVRRLTAQVIAECDNDSLLWFEEAVDADAGLDWLTENWTLSFWFAGLYVLATFSLQHYMKDKEAFDLRYPLALWSAALSVFSILGTWRTYPAIVYALYYYGLTGTTCNQPLMCAPSALWLVLFYWSKVFELVDTLFIVLRKKKLIFLHWYHHATVMVYVWYSEAEPMQAPGRWFMFMNYSVHSIMYAYYALSALRIRLPRGVAIIITTLQIAQMVWGLAINVFNLRIKLLGQECFQSYNNIILCTFMYLSYFVLFAQFFAQAYLGSGKKSTKTTDGVHKNGEHKNGVHKNGHKDGARKLGVKSARVKKID